MVRAALENRDGAAVARASGLRPARDAHKERRATTQRYPARDRRSTCTQREQCRQAAIAPTPRTTTASTRRSCRCTEGIGSAAVCGTAITATTVWLVDIPLPEKFASPK